MSKTGKEREETDSKPTHRRPEKLIRPGLSYEDDKEVVEIALKGDFAALEEAKAYLHERRKRIGSVDRERDHWMKGDEPTSPSELARRKVRDWLKNLLKVADDEKEIRKSVAAVMLGISQSEYNALLRDKNYSDIRAINRVSIKTTNSGQGKRFARSMVTLKVVRAIEQRRKDIERKPAAYANLPMATAKPKRLIDPVEAPFEVPEFHDTIAIHMNAEGSQAARVIGARYYHVVDPETNKIVGQLTMSAISNQRLAGFLTAGADMEYLTMHQALTQRTWLYVAEMKRWVDCFTDFAHRKQAANIALLDASRAAAVSEVDVVSLDVLAVAIENDNRNLSVQIAEVDKALLEHILPAGPERKHVPL